MLCKHICALFICTALSFCAFANTADNEPIHFIAPEIPGLIDASGQAPYNRVFTAITKQTGLDLQLTLMPIARAIHEYRSGRYSGIFPSIPETELPSSIKSEPFNNVRLLAFTHPDSKPIQSIAALKGLRVGLVRGMTYPSSLNRNELEVFQGSEDRQNIKMLLSGRLDVFIGAVPDTYLALKKMGINSQLSVDKSFHILSKKENFLLRDSPENRVLIEKINKAINQLKKNGEMARLLGHAIVE